MTRYRVHVAEESVLKAVVDAPPEVDAMTQEARREWLTEAALALADGDGPEAFDCYYGNTDFWKAAPTEEIDGASVSCEKCWNTAQRQAALVSGRVDDIYRGLLKAQWHAAHTPDEREGFTPY